MKKWIMRLWVVVFEVLLGHAGYSQAFDLVGMPSRTVPVSGTKMTNLVFPVALETGVKVSRDILVQRPRGVDNVIELKAVRRNFPTTNLSVFGKDGRLYTFDLRYVEDTTVLSFQVVPSGGASAVIRLTELPVNLARLDSDARAMAARPGFLHVSIGSGRMVFVLSGIYLRDGLMWFCFRVKNGTRIGFSPAYVRVFTEDRKKVKRTATQDVDVAPVYVDALGEVAGRASMSFVEAFAPFTVARGKRLVVQLADKTGGRSLTLVVKGKKVLKAKGT